MPKAFFIANGDDFKTPTGCRIMASYSLIVCSLSVDPAWIRRQLEPHLDGRPMPKLAGYVNARAVTLSGTDPANPHYSMREAMGLRRAGSGDPCVGPDDKLTWYFFRENTAEEVLTDPAYPKLVPIRPVLDAAEAYADWIVQHFGRTAWDVLYLDETWCSLPPRYWNLFNIWSELLSMDRWVHWRDYFLYALELGLPVPKIGNIGRPDGRFPKYLDAITIENRHGTPDEILEAFAKKPSPNNVWWNAPAEISINPSIAMPGVIR